MLQTITLFIQTAELGAVQTLKDSAMEIVKELETDESPETYQAFDEAWVIINLCNRRLRQLDSDTFYPSID